MRAGKDGLEPHILEGLEDSVVERGKKTFAFLRYGLIKAARFLYFYDSAIPKSDERRLYTAVFIS